MKPLAYLYYRLFVNILRRTLTTPKRLVPAIFMGLGFLYQIGFVAFLSVAGPSMGRNGFGLTHVLPPSMADAAWSVAFTALTAAVIWIIHSALSDGLLAYAPEHVDFLFPTPVSSRIVLGFRLLGDYVKYAFFVGFFICFAGGASVSGLFGASGIVMAWLGIVFLLISAMNATHTLRVVTIYGVRRVRVAASIFKWALLAIALLVVAATMVRYRADHEALSSLVSAISHGPVRILLIPVAWCTNLVVGPFIGDTNGARGSLCGLSVLALVSTIALLTRPENFYEPALAFSARMARIRSARKSGSWSAVRGESRRSNARSTYAGSVVPPFGTGAVSVLWKNLVVDARSSLAGWVGLLIVPPILVWIVSVYVGDADVQGFLQFFIPAFVYLFSLSTLQRIRGELKQANIVKSMPIAGTRMIFSWVIHIWMGLCAVVAMIALSIVAFVDPAARAWLDLCVVGALSAGLAGIATLTIPGLLYPDASDALQQMIPGLVAVLMFGLAMLPSIIVAAVGVSLQSHALTVGLLIVVNAAVTWGAVYIAGSLYDRFDPTSD